jgi:hypothetical protein
MINFYDKCYNKHDFTKKCSTEIREDMGIANEIEECLNKSFRLNTIKSVMVFTNDNLLLDDDYEVKNVWGIKVFPTLMVNDKVIHTEWTSQILLESICAGLKMKPKVCLEKAGFNKYNINKEEGVSFMTVFALVILIVTVNVIIVMFCKRYIARRIASRMENQDIDSKINNIVSSYLALSDTK